jgi:nitrite reductase (cytochrome c-552)
MESKQSKTAKVTWILALVFVLAAAAGAGVVALLMNIREKQVQGRQYPLMLNKVSDDDVSPEVWGNNFPSEYASYQKMAESDKPTMYGGNLPYSKLQRFPELTRLWAGYPFSMDFNEERGHYYAQIDQLETKRNDQAWLNANGFPAFQGQPGACMNCHSGWTPKLIRELGWEKFNSTPYKELAAKLQAQYGDGIHGGRLGGTCADCHSPEDMSLRVTRPAYINAMLQRGYEADPKQGLKATRQEMRSHVCQQCHVEYYFRPPHKELTFPWAMWPKDQPLRMEMIEAYYDGTRKAEGGFKYDWLHKESGAEMLKMQHPETELYSSGVHARTKVACADCHMPYQREGALKLTTHKICSPLFNINGSCQTCHPQPEGELAEKVEFIQKSTAKATKETEGAILALIDDIAAAKARLAGSKAYQEKPEGAERDKYLASVLAEARDFHRRASLRWDFISSENSTGFHSPQESMRVLAQAIDLARQGQLALVKSLKRENLALDVTVGGGVVPPRPTPVAHPDPAVGQPAPQWMMDLDSKL